MLRNVVFDMGNVLTEFNPDHFVRCVDVADEADRELLMNAVFRSEEWLMNDSGALSEKELEEIVVARIPERLHTAAHRLIFEWDQMSRPIAGMAELVRDCKAAGLGIYLLSNASVRQPEYWPSVPGSEYFDGTFISAFCRLVKPSREIFEAMLKEYGLSAAECLFVDDVQVNVDGAMAAGLQGFHFTGDAGALRQAIRGMGADV